MSVKYGQAFKLTHNTAKGFHIQLMVAPGTSINDFPEEIEVVSLNISILYKGKTERE